MHRRAILLQLAAVAGLAMVPSAASALPVHRRVRRRVVRRHVRRRFRRRAAWRVVAGRRLLVVPVAVAVGWELVVDDQPMTVVAIETRGGDEIVTVRSTSGATQQVVVIREDTPDNRIELEGSMLPDGDTSTPGRDDEIEVEE